MIDKEAAMLVLRSLFLITTLAIGLSCAATSAYSDERGDAISAAKNVMNALAQKNYSMLWDLTSDWLKTRTGANKQSFIANWAIQRASIGALKSSNILDVNYNTNDPSTGYVGKIYSVTFQNSYETGNSYERIIVIDENGQFKMSGSWGAPAQ